MIIIKDEDAGVLRIGRPAHTRITGTKITVLDVRRPRPVMMLYGFATPGTILTMRSYNHPFLA
jgi:hypothetical protein